MPRKKTTGRAVTAAKPDTNLAKLPQRLAIGDTEIRPTQLFVHTARHPKMHGPWSNEPDKLSWIDPKTGKDCILLRQYGGHWAGFVAVGIGRLIEKREQPVILGLRNRIVLVIMALGAAVSQSQERFGCMLNDVVQPDVAIEFIPVPGQEPGRP